MPNTKNARAKAANQNRDTLKTCRASNNVSGWWWYPFISMEDPGSGWLTLRSWILRNQGSLFFFFFCLSRPVELVTRSCKAARFMAILFLFFFPIIIFFLAPIQSNLDLSLSPSGGDGKKPERKKDLCRLQPLMLCAPAWALSMGNGHMLSNYLAN